MRLDVAELTQVIDIIIEGCGSEAAIVTQFALDLAIAARFNTGVHSIDAGEAQRLLRLRIARYRAAHTRSSQAVH